MLGKVVNDNPLIRIVFSCFININLINSLPCRIENVIVVVVVVDAKALSCIRFYKTSQFEKVNPSSSANKSEVWCFTILCSLPTDLISIHVALCTLCLSKVEDFVKNIKH